MNIKFYNTNLSFQFHPFVSKDATGKSTYNQQKALMTTVNWDGAFALYKVAHDIINGKDAANGVFLTIPCAGGAALILERKMGTNGQMETFFVISKNNETIPFKFSTHSIQVKENNQMIDKIIETGLGTFLKTIDGYLGGINADRHLDKMTEDYVKSLETSKTEGQQSGFQTGSNYNRGSGGYQKGNWNRGGGRRPYNNYNQGSPQPSFDTSQNQQNMSTYNLPQ